MDSDVGLRVKVYILREADKRGRGEVTMSRSVRRVCPTANPESWFKQEGWIIEDGVDNCLSKDQLEFFHIRRKDPDILEFMFGSVDEGLRAWRAYLNNEEA